MSSTTARSSVDVDLKQMLLLIVQSLVDYPEQVSITELQTAQTIIYQARVAPGEQGNVIGKGGRIATAIREILKSSSARLHVGFTFDIMGE